MITKLLVAELRFVSRFLNSCSNFHGHFLIRVLKDNFYYLKKEKKQLKAVADYSWQFTVVISLS